MKPNLPTGETISDGEDMPPMPKMPSDSDGDETQTVPLQFLAQPDDTEQMTTPEVGDKVQMQVEATIVSIDGDNATIKPTSINGNDLTPQPGDNEGTPDDTGDDTEDSLRGMAQGMSNSPMTS